MAERDSRSPRQGSGMTPHQKQDQVGNSLRPPAVAPASGVILAPDLQAHIGRHLRTVYDEVVNEAVPDRFVQLLEELERKHPGRKPSEPS